MADRTLIWYYPRHREAAEALLTHIPEARLRGAKGWNGKVEERSPRVIVDNDAPEIADAYEASGAEVEWLFDPVAAPRPRLEPEAESAPVLESAPDDPMALPPGYRLEHRPPWYSVFGPDGEKVGKSQRDAAAAVAQVTA